MFKMKNLNVIRIVQSEKERDELKSKGFKEMSVIPTDYSSMSLDELKKIANDKNIQGYSDMKKEDLVAVLNSIEKSAEVVK